MDNHRSPIYSLLLKGYRVRRKETQASETQKARHDGVISAVPNNMKHKSMQVVSNKSNMLAVH